MPFICVAFSSSALLEHRWGNGHNGVVNWKLFAPAGNLSYVSIFHEIPSHLLAKIKKFGNSKDWCGYRSTQVLKAGVCLQSF